MAEAQYVFLDHNVKVDPAQILIFLLAKPIPIFALLVLL